MNVLLVNACTCHITLLWEIQLINNHVMAEFLFGFMNIV